MGIEACYYSLAWKVERGKQGGIQRKSGKIYVYQLVGIFYY
jgi:hypothetical protein